MCRIVRGRRQGDNISISLLRFTEKTIVKKPYNLRTGSVQPNSRTYKPVLILSTLPYKGAVHAKDTTVTHFEPCSGLVRTTPPEQAAQAMVKIRTTPLPNQRKVACKELAQMMEETEIDSVFQMSNLDLHNSHPDDQQEKYPLYWGPP